MMSRSSKENKVEFRMKQKNFPNSLVAAGRRWQNKNQNDYSFGQNLALENNFLIIIQ